MPRPANAGAQPLRDAFDDAAFSSRVSAFEKNDNLQLLVHHPVLQLHKLALQAEKLLEIKVPIDRKGL